MDPSTGVDEGACRHPASTPAIATASTLNAKPSALGPRYSKRTLHADAPTSLEGWPRAVRASDEFPLIGVQGSQFNSYRPDHLKPSESWEYGQVLTVPAWIRKHVGMVAKAHQYTIRNVPPRVHRALRKKAAERGVSLNTLLVQTLEAEAGERGEPRAHDDLDDLFGTWVHDKAVDKALAEQRKVDPRDWA